MTVASSLFALRGNVVILGVLLLVAGLMSEHFWTAENVVNVLRAASLIGIIAIGMNVVIIAGGIDLSVGSVVALTGAVAASLWVSDAGFLIVILGSLGVALAVGLANGALVSVVGLQPFVATLIMMTVARGAGLVYTGGQPIYADYPASILFLSRGWLFGLPVPTVLFGAIALITWYIMKWRVIGREIYATGANETAARLSGVNVGRVKALTYLYCALLAGISGLVLTSRMESGQPGQAGVFWELDAIAAVVIGGTSIRGGSGSVWGAVVGALIIGIISNMFNLLGIGPAWQQVAKGAIIVLAVVLQMMSTRGVAVFAAVSLPSLAIGRATAATLVAITVFVGSINLILANRAPDLFQVDLAKAPYTRANNLELTRVYHRAIPLYQQVIDEHPDSEYAILARIGIASSQRKRGDLEAAAEAYTLLLDDIATETLPQKFHYRVLSDYADMLRDTGDVVAFAQVYEMLFESFPDSLATREAAQHMTAIAAAAAAAEAGAPVDGPVIIPQEEIAIPERVKLGETFDISITVLPREEGRSPDFSLVTGLSFWRGFNLVRATPAPRSVSEFWGRRVWSYGGIDAPKSVVATLRAVQAGTFDFDLDVEVGFEVLEYGINFNIIVEE